MQLELSFEPVPQQLNIEVKLMGTLLEEPLCVDYYLW